MGCTSCGTGSSGGCKSSGSCSSGGCNKMEVYNWLANVALPSGQSPYEIIEIRFKNSRKGFYRNSNNSKYQVGDVVIVEGNPGYDVGVVSIVGELARIQVRKKEPGLVTTDAKRIKRIAEQEDIDKWIKARSLEKEVMYKARVLAVNLGLEMKISDVEYQGDLTKATFYYTAEGRIDFRQLIRDMAGEFKIRIEMKQIGSRQEASRLGGIGSCGRELCCSTWLTDFRSVSTGAARYQQLSLNPQKLAGQCGKLKCCLNYELDMYIDAMKAFPKGDVRLKTEKGTAVHIKTDVFKQQMWYAFEGEMGGGLIPLHPDRAREIIRMNKDGKKPYDLKDFVEIEEVSQEPNYTNAVGQESLNRFDDAFKKKKKQRPTKKKTGNQNSNKGGNKNGEKVDKAEPNKNKPRPNNRNRNKNNRNKNKENQENKTPQAKKEGESTKPQAKKPNNRRKKPNPNQVKKNEDTK